VSDPYRKLTTAVVEIGTQLRRLADAHTTPVADAPDAPATTCSAQHHRFDPIRDCIRAAHHTGLDHVDEHGFHWSDTVAVYPVTDAPPTTPDNGRRITSWLPTSPELAAQRAETMNMLERYIDSRTCPTPETHNWGCGCPTDEAPAAHTKTLRWARRESLLVLLTRVQHGRTLTDDEARTLRHHVETEMGEAETARERAEEAEVRAAVCREDAEHNATRAETAEQRRDQLAATLREVLSLITPALVNGKYAFYQASDQPIAPQDYQRWHAALQPPAAEDKPAAGCVPGPYDDCPNCPHDTEEQPDAR
jgi:hypothetical protein